MNAIVTHGEDEGNNNMVRGGVDAIQAAEEHSADVIVVEASGKGKGSWKRRAKGGSSSDSVWGDFSGEKKERES